MVLDFLILFCQLVILAFQIIQLRNQFKLFGLLCMTNINIKGKIKQILSSIINKFKRD